MGCVYPSRLISKASSKQATPKASVAFKAAKQSCTPCPYALAFTILTIWECGASCLTRFKLYCSASLSI